MLGLSATLTEAVFVYLYVRHSVTWILTSSYHYLLKNIVHVIMALSCLSATFTEAVYVYLCICTSDTWDHCFRGLCIITFQKICGLYGPKPFRMKKN